MVTPRAHPPGAHSWSWGRKTYLYEGPVVTYRLPLAPPWKTDMQTAMLGDLLSTTLLEALTEHLVQAVLLYYLTALGPWQRCLISLPLSFLIYKMGWG